MNPLQRKAFVLGYWYAKQVLIQISKNNTKVVHMLAMLPDRLQWCVLSLTKSLDQKYSMGMLINQIKKVYLTITKCSCQIRSRASLHNPNWANTFYLKGSQYILVLLHSVPERFKLMTSCNRQHLPPTRLRTKHLTLTNCFLNVAVTTLTLNCKVELNLTELQTTPFGLLSTQYTKRLISQVIRVTASM